LSVFDIEVASYDKVITKGVENFVINWKITVAYIIIIIIIIIISCNIHINCD